VTFYHHKLVTDADGAKLSKSAGATSIKHLRETLRTPTALYMHISDLLGISPAARNWEELGRVGSQVLLP
jgi:glutamyl/glutaminyl-tRNA synthetase